MTHGNVSWDTQTLRIQQYMYTDNGTLTRAADEFRSLSIRANQDLN